jgi:hypothetical protein
MIADYQLPICDWRLPVKANRHDQSERDSTRERREVFQRYNCNRKSEDPPATALWY